MQDRFQVKDSVKDTSDKKITQDHIYLITHHDQIKPTRKY